MINFDIRPGYISGQMRSEAEGKAEQETQDADLHAYQSANNELSAELKQKRAEQFQQDQVAEAERSRQEAITNEEVRMQHIFEMVKELTNSGTIREIKKPLAGKNVQFDIDFKETTDGNVSSGYSKSLRIQIKSDKRTVHDFSLHMSHQQPHWVAQYLDYDVKRNYEWRKNEPGSKDAQFTATHLAEGPVRMDELKDIETLFEQALKPTTELAQDIA